VGVVGFNGEQRNIKGVSEREREGLVKKKESEEE
jgi:hypothetical protein